MSMLYGETPRLIAHSRGMADALVSALAGVTLELSQIQNTEHTVDKTGPFPVVAHVDASSLSFGKIFELERGHLIDLTLESLEKLDEVERLAEAARSCVLVASNVRYAPLELTTSRGSVSKTNINLGLVKKSSDFYIKSMVWAMLSSSVHGQGRVEETCGAIGMKIVSRVQALASVWLRKLDSLLASVRMRKEQSKMRVAPRSEEEQVLVSDTIDTLSTMIALNAAGITFSEAGLETKEAPEADLSSNRLEKMIDEQFFAVEEAEESKNKSLLKALNELLRVVETVFQFNDWRPELPVIDERSIRLLESKPACVDTISWEKSQFILLCVAVNPSVSLEMRKAFAAQWFQSEEQDAPAFALSCLRRAITNLKTHTGRRRAFKPVVRRSSENAKFRDHHVPRLSWTNQRFVWEVVDVQTAVREGLDAVREDIVRLVSAVWQLFGGGTDSRGDTFSEFPRAIVSEEIVSTLALQEHVRAQTIYQDIVRFRNKLETGVRLAAFRRQVFDRSGYHQNEAWRSLCHLSHFSLHEVFSAFAKTSPISPIMIAGLTSELSRRGLQMRECMSTLFVQEVVLTVVADRRGRLGIDRFDASSFFRDLMIAEPSVRNWTSTEGELILSPQDISHALKNILMTLAVQHPLLLSYETRAMHKEDGRLSRGKRFVFDSNELVAMMA